MHSSCIFIYIIYFVEALALSLNPGSHPNWFCDLSKQQISLKFSIWTLKWILILFTQLPYREGWGNDKVQDQCAKQGPSN